MYRLFDPGIACLQAFRRLLQSFPFLIGLVLDRLHLIPDLLGFRGGFHGDALVFIHESLDGLKLNVPCRLFFFQNMLLRLKYVCTRHTLTRCTFAVCLIWARQAINDLLNFIHRLWSGESLGLRDLISRLRRFLRCCTRLLC